MQRACWPKGIHAKAHGQNPLGSNWEVLPVRGCNTHISCCLHSRRLGKQPRAARETILRWQEPHYGLNRNVNIDSITNTTTALTRLLNIAFCWTPTFRKPGLLHLAYSTSKHTSSFNSARTPHDKLIKLCYISSQIQLHIFSLKLLPSP